MTAFIATLRDGSWLTRERMRMWGLAVLVASAIGFLFLVVTSDGLNDYQGRPLGTDFSNVYAAGTYALDGHAAMAFDWPAQHAREQAIFGDKTPFYGWHYPPFFLFVAALLALMPYALALAVWQGATIALYLVVIRMILTTYAASPSPLRGGSRGEAARGGGDELEATPHPPPSAATSPARGEVKKEWLVLAVAFPAVFINIGHGHNGFLTAALIGAALVVLERRPILSGVLFGLLVYKPQFGLLIPLALLAGGHGRAFIAAGATVAVLALITTLVFGTEIWSAFLASTHLTRVEVLEQGGTGWHKIQSIFSVVRMWGGSVPAAYVAQGALTLALAAALVWLWRGDARKPIKAAALCVAAILATPYSLDYDMMVLAPAIAFAAADGFTRGFHPWEKTALAFLWFVPLIARTLAEHTLIPLGVPAMLAVFVLLMHRVVADRAAAGYRIHHIAAE